MPRGGGNALPSAVKRLRGTARRCRARNEPQPKAVTPRVPRDLPPGARKYWKKQAPRLARLGLLTELDLDSLREWCMCRAFEDQANETLAREGLLIPVGGERTGLKKNPAAQLSRDFGQRAAQIAAQFGMTPASRGRLSVPEPTQGDVVDDLSEYDDLEAPEDLNHVEPTSSG